MTEQTDEYMGTDPQNGDEMDFGTPPRPNTGEWKTITDRRVSSRRIILTERQMERHDFDLSEWVDVVLYPDDGDAVPLPGEQIGTKNRITVPTDKVRRHDLNGTTVDLHIRSTEDDEE